MRRFLSPLVPASMAAAVALSAGGAFAQSRTDYQYDAQGRLIAAADTDGMTSRYAYDDADNRTERDIGNPFAAVWLAETLPHITGAADGTAWVGRPGMSAGYLTYGPYVTTIPAGSRTAVYRIMVDQVTPSASTIVAVDVYDVTANEFLLQLNLTPDDFDAPYVYQFIEIPFTYDSSRLGHSIEIRTWYGGFGTAWVDKIGYR